MIDCGSLEYAQARIQARHGQRPDELAWQRLETAREFTALLEAARQTSLRHWITGITAPAAPRRIEATLRARWRDAVAEVARWMPPPWQAALHWSAVLPDLPVLQHLALGREPLDWMADDPEYRRLAAASAPERRAAVEAGAYAALARAWPAPQSLAQEWHAEFLRRLPQQGGDHGLMQLAAVLRDHSAVFAGAGAAGQGWLLRRALRGRLVLLLRRATGEPSVAFIHLALTALDLERLRGELMVRALFARLAQRQVA